MKVTCRLNDLGSLKNSPLYEFVCRYMRYDDDIDLHYIKGKEYWVYGVEFRDSYPFYYILTDDTDEYPIPAPACFFEVTDSRLSKYWVIVFSYEPPAYVDYKQGSSFLLASDWAADEMFYENLLDGEPLVVEKFKEIRKMIEGECFVE